MILGYTAAEIIELALESQNNMSDGCALYDYDEGKMVSGGYTSGTIENPENHLLEVYRIKQGALNTDGFDCYDCPYDDEEYIAKMKRKEPDLYTSKEECCKNVWFDMACENFYDDFCDSPEEMLIRQEIRDIIHGCISDDLSKLHEIYIKRYEFFASPVGYQRVICNDNYEMNILDNLEDIAMEEGFKIVDSKTFLSGDIEYEQIHWDSIACDSIDENLTDAERKLASDVASKLLDDDLDGALELLQ